MTDVPSWSRLDKQAFYDERAGIIEFDGGLSRADAEAQALAELYDALMARPPSGILQELAAADRVRHSPMLADTLRALGLEGVRSPAWGFGWCVFENGTSRPAAPDEQGAPCVIVPEFRDGKLHDLIASDILGEQVASRLGVTGVLGFDEIERARASGRPLLAFDHVFRWLRGNGRGVCVVDWERAAFDLDGVPALLCRTDAMADRLERITRNGSPRPLIVVVKGARNEAA